MNKLFSVLILLSALILSSFNEGNPGLKIGDKAYDFKLRNIDNKLVSFKSFKNAKGYIVIFTCNHCPFSIAYEERIIALHKKYEPLGYPVIAINPNDKERQPEDSFEKMKERAKEKKFPFVYLYDETQEIAAKYGATRTPHVFLLDKDLVVKYIGAIDDNHEEPSEVKDKYLEKALEELKGEKEISRPETKAIGCTIKWRKK